MDYGKAAYLKAEELESRLNTVLLRGSESATACRTIRPRAELADGAAAVGLIKGEGAMTVMVQLTLGGLSGPVIVSIAVGGLTAAEVTASGKSESETVSAMCSVYVSGSAEVIIRLASGGECRLDECALLVGGRGAALVSAGSAATDLCHGKWALVVSEESDVMAYTFTESAFALSKPVYIGTGTNADVSAGDSGFFFTYVDPMGNAWLVRTDINLSVKSREFVCDGAERVAVFGKGERATVAVLSGPELFCYAADEYGGVSSPVSVPAGVEVTGVSFVKNAITPTLIAESAAGSFLIPSDYEYNAGAHRLTCAMELEVGPI